MKAAFYLSRVLFSVLIIGSFEAKAQTSFWVTNTSDSGPGSLRQAIDDANSTTGFNSIYFSIPGMAPHIIMLQSQLPAIADPVSIDGFTQPNNGYTGTDPKIKLDLTAAGNSSVGINIQASNSSVYGLFVYNGGTGIIVQGSNCYIGSQTKRNVVSDNQSCGIIVEGSNHTIENNYVGTTPDGSDTLGFQGSGIKVYSNTVSVPSRNIYIKNNVISSKGSNGGVILLGYGRISQTYLYGNKIGTNAAGTARLADWNFGIFIEWNCDSIYIGSGAPGYGNLISGNLSSTVSGVGINVQVYNPALVSIKGNKIGTDITGSYSIGNNYGIKTYYATDLIIGGSGGEGNLVSGNYYTGIYLLSSLGTIKGNYVGTTANGLTALPNSLSNPPTGGTGIYIYMSRVTIGSPWINEGNIISGNYDGLELEDSDSCIIEGNKIGVTANNSPLGNAGNGIKLARSNYTKIGGVTLAEGNVIANNANSGVYIFGLPPNLPAANNLVSKNSFYNNQFKGICLWNSGNNSISSPVITLSCPDSVKGTSLPQSTIQLYYHQSSNNIPQGKVYITSVNADTLGNWKYIGTITQPCSVVALAIDNNSNTSEFSNFPPVTWSPNLGPDLIYNCVSSATLASGISNMASYQWSTGATTQNISVNASGNYWVAVTDNCGNMLRDTVNITINQPPVVSFSPLSSVCVNAAAFALSASPASGTFSGTGVSGSAFDPVVAGAGSHSITYTYVDSNGCSSSVVQNIAVHALPVITLASFAPVCANAASLPLSGGSPSGGAYAGTGVSGSTFDPAIAGAGSHSITYAYIDSNGCSSSATENITVHALPAVSLSSFNSMCDNSAPSQLSGGMPAGGSYSGTAISSGSFDPSVAGAGQHLVTYAYIDANGCTNSDTASLIVYPAPAVTLASFADVCADTVQVALNGGTPSGGAYSGPAVTGSAFDPSIAGAGTHTITYTVTDTDGCSSQALENITVHPLPQAPSITQSFSDLISSQGTSYQWFLNGSIIPGATQQVHTPVVNGDYTVMIIDSNGCSMLSALFPFYSVGIASQENERSFDLYPNPTSGILYCNLKEQKADLLIHDAAGRLVATFHLIFGTNVLDVMSIASGAYTCTLKNENGIYLRNKLVLVKITE